MFLRYEVCDAVVKCQNNALDSPYIFANYVFTCLLSAAVKLLVERVLDEVVFLLANNRQPTKGQAVSFDRTPLTMARNSRLNPSFQ